MASGGVSIDHAVSALFLVYPMVAQATSSRLGTSLQFRDVSLRILGGADVRCQYVFRDLEALPLIKLREKAPACDAAVERRPLAILANATRR